MEESEYGVCDTMPTPKDEDLPASDDA